MKLTLFLLLSICFSPAAFAQTAQDYLRSGNECYSQSNFDHAIYEYTKAIELAPESGEAYFSRGIVYMGKGEPDMAIADFQKTLNLKFSVDEKILQETHLALADAYYDKGKYADAISNLTQAIEINSDFAPAYAQRGMCYIMLQDYDGALADLDKAVDLNPNDVAALNSRAVVYLFKKDFEKALEDVQAIQKLGGEVLPMITEELNKQSEKEK